MAKILVVDDEEDICELLRDLLVDWGHEVATVNNGEEAVRLLTNGDYNVLLLDRRMPGMKGQEVLGEIRAAKISCQVVVMTADVDDASHDEMISLGATGVITKPFDILKLKDQLGDILPLVFKN